MSAPMLWRIVPTLVVACAIGAAYAKLPPPTEAEKAAAAAAAAKAAEAAKKAREAELQAMDRVVERYKREKGMTKAADAPAAPMAEKMKEKGMAKAAAAPDPMAGKKK